MLLKEIRNNPRLVMFFLFACKVKYESFLIFSTSCSARIFPSLTRKRGPHVFAIFSSGFLGPRNFSTSHFLEKLTDCELKAAAFFGHFTSVIECIQLGNVYVIPG